MPILDVIYEDNHLLVINKPAGIATQGAAAGEDSAVTRARQYLKQKYDQPGNVYLGVVSRLDAMVTGVLVLARTSKAAARLTKQFAERSTNKIYLAVVEGQPHEGSGRLVHYLRKDEQQHRMVVADASHPDAQSAELTFRVLAKLRHKALLQVHLLTGRKHQIRVQLAEYGVPIVGDRKYNGSMPLSAGIALHARLLEIAHPTLQTPLRFAAPVPASWQSLGVTEQFVRGLGIT